MIDKGLIGIYTDKDLKTAVKNIKCPLHHVLKPGLPYYEAYQIEPNPNTKHFSNDLCEKFGLKRWRYKKDAFGNKIPNYRNHYQPEISALYAKERIYSPGHPTCRKCRRCFQ